MYATLELTLLGSEQDCQPNAVFTHANQIVKVQGYSENERKGTVRFMPTAEGVWHYELTWGGAVESGEFLCTPAVSHGPVQPDGMHFRYADGTRYIPFGTTCYAWIHQSPEVIRQTLETLKTAPFNKIRMCIFPKSMPFNENDPDFYPFEKRTDGTWDVSKPDQRYWEHLDDMLVKLDVMGIEADLILFHPYDRWGFSKMPQEDNLTYVQYAVRRLSAHRNIWWSLSNEYEFCFAKTIADWDQYGELIAAQDPYHHLISAHNWITPYPKRDWMTHVSYQGSRMTDAFEIREEYRLPTIVDECGYEGDIEFFWGDLSGFEFMNRVWTATAFGCYAMHGETFYRDDEILWWAKGGQLYGKAPVRIAFLREVLESLPGPIEPACVDRIRDPNGSAVSEGQKQLFKMIWDMNSQKAKDQIKSEMMQPIGRHPDFRLIYLGRSARSYSHLSLPANGSYNVELLDIWDMTRTPSLNGVSGDVYVHLPGKEGTAILITRNSGEVL